jgi:hypothetical protein
MHISLQMCGGVHVCTCVNLYVRVSTYMHHVSVVVCMCLCAQKCTGMHVCVCIKTCVRVYVCLQIRTWVLKEASVQHAYIYVLVCLRK